MDLMPALVRKIGYPVWMLKDGDTGILRYLHHYDFIDKLGQDEALQRQREHLRNVLIHAYENTEYYKDLFHRVAFAPYRFEDCSELEVIPLLTKEIVRTNPDRIIARNFDRGDLFDASTGGSTGLPMKFYRNRECVYQRRGQQHFFFRWMGYEIADKVARFVSPSHYYVLDSWKAKIRNATCEREINFDPYRMTHEYMAQFAQRYIRFRPKILIGFQNALLPFVEYLESNNIRLPPVNSISCIGENLYTRQRRLFEDIFGGEVFDNYATRECGVIASECRYHQGMHVFTEGVYLEVLDDKGRPVPRGEMGKIVVTDLFNQGFPLIRYEIGDMGILSARESCPCGSPLPLLERLLGRERDILIDSYGNPKPGAILVEEIHQLNLPAQFQIVQTDRRRLVIRVVNKAAERLDLTALEKRFQDIMGPHVRIHIEYVESIERDPSGKYRYVISELKKT